MADQVALGRLPAGTALVIVDADLSTVSTAADKLVRVDGPEPYAAHAEFQSGPDPNLDRRVMVYNVLARHRLDLPVWSVVFLLRPQGLKPSVNGWNSEQTGRAHELVFSCNLARVWEIPVASLLAGGLGTLPLAPIGAVAESELPGVVGGMRRRLEQEATAGEAAELWTATRILMGLRWPTELLGQLLEGVQGMKESTTYQEILYEGFEQGLEQGRVAEARLFLLRHGAKRLGPPDAAVRAKVEALADLNRLEELADHGIDGQAKTWSELLGPDTHLA